MPYAEQLQRLQPERPLQMMPAVQMAPVQKDDTTTKEISETNITGNKYTQELVLNKTQKKIQIQMGVNWVKKGTWTDDDAKNAFVRRVKTAAYSYMDNKFKVVCKPKAIMKLADQTAKPINLPIDFLIWDDSSGYKIDTHGGAPGGDASMGTNGGTFYEYCNGSLEDNTTFAHEFGHCMLGQTDEYYSPNYPDRPLSNDHSIMANYYAQGIDQAAFKARHFKHIAQGVASAFAGYSCGIEAL